MEECKSLQETSATNFRLARGCFDTAIQLAPGSFNELAAIIAQERAAEVSAVTRFLLFGDY